VPEFKKVTEDFFEIVKIGKRFEVYIIVDKHGEWI